MPRNLIRFSRLHVLYSVGFCGVARSDGPVGQRRSEAGSGGDICRHEFRLIGDLIVFTQLILYERFLQLGSSDM